MTQIATIVTLVWKHFTLELIVTDDAVNLTSEKHDLNAQMNHLQKEENKKTLQKTLMWCRPNTLQRSS